MTRPLSPLVLVGLAGAGGLAGASAVLAAGGRLPGTTTTVLTARPGRPAASVRIPARTLARFRGPRGFRGFRGLRGPAGPGGSSAPGARSLRLQSVSVNWQNGHFDGRDRASFLLPGIGRGEVVCRPDTQWIRIFPAGASDDVTMWLVTNKDGLPASVRTARRERFSGPDFNEGFNRYVGQAMAVGAFDGLVSSRGDRTAAGGPGPAPTTIHLSYTWDFTNSAAARCYVAATFGTAV